MYTQKKEFLTQKKCPFKGHERKIERNTWSHERKLACVVTNQLFTSNTHYSNRY